MYGREEIFKGDTGNEKRLKFETHGCARLRNRRMMTDWEFRTTERERDWGPGGVVAIGKFPANVRAERLVTETLLFDQLKLTGRETTGQVRPKNFNCHYIIDIVKDWYAQKPGQTSKYHSQFHNSSL